MVSFDPALVVPLAVLSLPLLYIASRLYSTAAAKKKLATTGIGRGAPGFLTGVRKVTIPPHIAARIRMGEEVSGEEITAALEEERERLEEEERVRLEREDADRKRQQAPVKVPDTVDTEWLPQGALGGAKSQGRRRKK